MQGPRDSWSSFDFWTCLLYYWRYSTLAHREHTASACATCSVYRELRNIRDSVLVSCNQSRCVSGVRKEPSRSTYHESNIWWSHLGDSNTAWMKGYDDARVMISHSVEHGCTYIKHGGSFAVQESLRPPLNSGV